MISVKALRMFSASVPRRLRCFSGPDVTTGKRHITTRDFRLPPQRDWNLRSSGTLRGV